MKACVESEIKRLVTRYPALGVCEDSIRAAVRMMIHSYGQGGKLLTCGNGGSASDSMHIVGELMKGFALPRPLGNQWRERFESACPETAEYLLRNLQGALPANSLVSEVALSTAYANDQAPDLAFAQSVFGLGRPGDVLLGISTSGDSSNVLYAADVARAMGIKVVGLTGETGGQLASRCDVCIRAPSKVTYQIQEYHLPIYHGICLALEQAFFGSEG